MLLPFQERKEETERNRTSANRVSHQRIPPRSPQVQIAEGHHQADSAGSGNWVTSSSSLRGFESLQWLLLPPTWWWKPQAGSWVICKRKCKESTRSHSLRESPSHRFWPRYLRGKADQGPSSLQVAAKREPRMVIEIYTHRMRRLLNSPWVHPMANAWIFQMNQPQPQPDWKMLCSWMSLGLPHFQIFLHIVSSAYSTVPLPWQLLGPNSFLSSKPHFRKYLGKGLPYMSLEMFLKPLGLDLCSIHCTVLMSVLLPGLGAALRCHWLYYADPTGPPTGLTQQRH